VCREHSRFLTRMQAGRLVKMEMISWKSKIYSVLRNFLKNSEVHPAFHSVGTGGCFPSGKVAKAWR